MTKIIGIEEGVDPAAVVDQIVVYSKDVGGVTQLFGRASDGSIYQITPPSTSTVFTYTFRPGSALTGPYVFDDFTALYTALDAARTAAQNSGGFSIVFDELLGALVVPAGTYDMTGVSWISVHGDQGGGFNRFSDYPVELVDGVTITGLLSITGLLVTPTEASVTPPITLAVGPLHLYGATLQGNDNTQCCITTAPNACGVVVHGFGKIGGGDEAQAAIDVGSGHLLNVWLAGVNAAIAEYALDDSGGEATITIIASEESSTYFNQQIYLVATPVILQECPMWQWQGDPNGYVDCGTNRYELVDSSTGARWRNVDSGGTNWVLDQRAWSYPKVNGGVSSGVPFLTITGFKTELGKRYNFYASGSFFANVVTGGDVVELALFVVQDSGKSAITIVHEDAFIPSQGDTDASANLAGQGSVVGDGAAHDYTMYIFSNDIPDWKILTGGQAQSGLSIVESDNPP